MKITELRIGNIVKQGTIVELRFNAARVKYTLDCKERMSLIRYDDLESVLLTEERLPKLGFDFVNELHAYADENHYIIPFDVHDGSMQFHPFCTNDEDCWMTIQYVHELQNLVYELDKKELELKP